MPSVPQPAKKHAKQSSPKKVKDLSKPSGQNQLAQEKSPYLLQHASNPVHWLPWGEKAFAQARQRNKLMLISIGYATCHWCHVMERETFTDPTVADFLNKHFVPVKVDREEHPDVDRIYLEALQAFGQQGGWPLNMFTTPDGKPVTGGTYFPPQPAYGRKSFLQVLELVSSAWNSQKETILQNAQQLTRHLQEHASPISPSHLEWNHQPLKAALGMYKKLYDSQYGGFQLQPQNKFPPSMGLQLLLRCYLHTKEPQALDMVEHTLKQIMAGGIYDQIGGGISRYSTDYQWHAPHFEKMLYDNALFAIALTETYQITGKEVYKVWAEDVLNYMLADLRLHQGGFASAEDADSEGEEGLFYLWTPKQVRQTLPKSAAEAALVYWDITPQGNFENGRSIPRTLYSLKHTANELGISQQELTPLLLQARQGLLKARSQRIRPLRDDKVLSSWNALVIMALTQAAMAFSHPPYLASAVKAARFILKHLRSPQGRLLRRWRENEARHDASLGDHALLGLACLKIYQAQGDIIWFKEALQLAEAINILFYNPDGPYFDSPCDSQHLIARTASGYDGVEPSGNSAAAMLFLQLYAYGCGQSWQAHALRIFAGFQQQIQQVGVSFPAMLAALDFHLASPKEIAIVAEEKAAQLLLQTIHTRFFPHVVVAFSTPQQQPAHAKTVPLLQNKQPENNQPTAWICTAQTCQAPVHTPQDLLQQLTPR